MKLAQPPNNLVYAITRFAESTNEKSTYKKKKKNAVKISKAPSPLKIQIDNTNGEPSPGI